MIMITFMEFLEFLYEKYIFLRTIILNWLHNLWSNKDEKEHFDEEENNGWQNSSEQNSEEYSYNNYGSLNSRINPRDMARILEEIHIIYSETDVDNNLTNSSKNDETVYSPQSSDDTQPLINDGISDQDISSETDEFISSFELINHE